ncbi:hypothetical protein O6P43_020383 [Quillaja saponaria]|uniref:Uncharacterized protein n=1 Tax=Quillaja saponaria TaxID=32244 RepID=A0AAD7LMS0_QUISA|nr:hypothetical protein O6P43_020383 [Quillaja saponaria]
MLTLAHYLKVLNKYYVGSSDVTGIGGACLSAQATLGRDSPPEDPSGESKKRGLRLFLLRSLLSQVKKSHRRASADLKIWACDPTWSR